MQKSNVYHTQKEVGLKFETMVLCQKRGDCSFWVGGELLPQVEEFYVLYLGVLSYICWENSVRLTGRLMCHNVSIVLDSRKRT